MPISVVDPVGPAIERTKKVLFRPFDLGKWFVLGFCAFLAQLGEGGGIPSFNSGGRGGGGGDDFKQAMQWAQDNLVLILTIAAAVILVVIVLGLVLTWLSCRGKFMFLHGVARTRAAVVEPWKDYRREGNSLFGFRVMFGLAMLVCMLVTVGVALLIALPDIRAHTFGGAAIAALVAGGLLFLLLLITENVVNLFLLDFVVPVMYLRRLRVLAAWGVFRNELLAGHAGTFILYTLFKIVINMSVGMLTLLVTCATCCIAILPYVGTVILLPFFVFMQAYPLYFLQQFGPEWRYFQRAPVLLDEAESGASGEDRPPDDRFFSSER